LSEFEYEGGFYGVALRKYLYRYEHLAFQTSLALLFDILGLLSGWLAATYLLGLKYPWLLILYPGILGVRGAISGIFSGRLGTSLHLGLVKPGLRKNTYYFNLLVASTFTLPLIGGLLSGFMTLSVVFLFYRASFIEVLILPLISTTVIFLSTLILVPLASQVAFTAFRYGLDPDVVLYPIMSTIADLGATAIYIVVVEIYFRYSLIPLLSFFAACLAISVISYLKFGKEREFAESLRESIYAMLFLLFFENVAGSALHSISGKIEKFASLMALYPVLIDSLGDIGSITGSRLTTLLAVGHAKNWRELLKACGGDLLIVSATAMLFYSLLGFTASSINTSLLLILIGCAIAVALIIPISIFTAVVTHRYKLNPDNFVNPIVSSMADGLMTLSLLLAAFLF